MGHVPWAMKNGKNGNMRHIVLYLSFMAHDKKAGY